MTPWPNDSPLPNENKKREVLLQEAALAAQEYAASRASLQRQLRELTGAMGEKEQLVAELAANEAEARALSAQYERGMRELESEMRRREEEVKELRAEIAVVDASAARSEEEVILCGAFLDPSESRVVAPLGARDQLPPISSLSPFPFLFPSSQGNLPLNLLLPRFPLFVFRSASCGRWERPVSAR